MKYPSKEGLDSMKRGDGVYCGLSINGCTDCGFFLFFNTKTIIMIIIIKIPIIHNQSIFITI